jgi:hypothetical protein
MKRAVVSSATATFLCAETVVGFSISDGLQLNLSTVDRRFDDANKAMTQLSQLNEQMQREFA